MEQKKLKDYVSGKRVLIVSTEKNFCDYTYDILLEVGRYDRSHEMMESMNSSARMRKLLIKAGLACRNMKDFDVIVICAGKKEKLLNTHRKFTGKTVVYTDLKKQVDFVEHL